MTLYKCFGRLFPVRWHWFCW